MSVDRFQSILEFRHSFHCKVISFILILALMHFVHCEILRVHASTTTKCARCVGYTDEAFQRVKATGDMNLKTGDMGLS